MNAVQEKLAQVVTAKAGAKAVAGAATLSEGAEALRDLIVGLLQPVPTPGNEGTFCGLLAYNAQQRLAFADPDSRGLEKVYDAQAMIHGALRSDDAAPGQVAILEVAAECIDQLGNLLDLVDPPKPASSAMESSKYPRDTTPFALEDWSAVYQIFRAIRVAFPADDACAELIDLADECHDGTDVPRQVAVLQGAMALANDDRAPLIRRAIDLLNDAQLSGDVWRGATLMMMNDVGECLEKAQDACEKNSNVFVLIERARTYLELDIGMAMLADNTQPADIFAMLSSLQAMMLGAKSVRNCPSVAVEYIDAANVHLKDSDDVLAAKVPA